MSKPTTGLKKIAKAEPRRRNRREFYPECGTHMVTKVPGLPAVVLKVGTFDDPALFDPQMAIYTVDKQAFHHVPDGMPACRHSSGCRGDSAAGRYPPLSDGVINSTVGK